MLPQLLFLEEELVLDQKQVLSFPLFKLTYKFKRKIYVNERKL
jgi:hypothetical protein